MAVENTRGKFNHSQAEVLNKIDKVIKEDLGFEKVNRVEVGGEICIVAVSDGRPAVLAYAPQSGGPITPTIEEIAIQLGATIAGGPADYVWASATGELGDGFIFSWLPDKECQVSHLPSRQEWQKETGAVTPRDPRKASGLIRRSAADTGREDSLGAGFLPCSRGVPRGVCAP